jgi:hypothetical protein
MFRKPSKKRPAQLRQRRKEEEDDTEEDDDDDVKAKIQTTQKKLKLMSSLPLVTGELSTRSSSTGNPLSESSTSGDLSVLDKKHQQAMQDYIEEELDKGNNNNSNNNSNNKSSITNDAENEATAKPATDQDELYQELAKEVYSSEKTNLDQEERGAVLVGGTGLAEVILPSSSDALSKSKQNNRAYRKGNTSSAVPSASKTAVNLAVSVPLMRSMIQPSKKHRQQPKSTEEEERENEKADTSGDSDRVGFAAYRGKPQEKKPVTKKQRDDHVFSDFMKHQRQKFLSRR